jgi:vitamin B12 transporter
MSVGAALALRGGQLSGAVRWVGSRSDRDFSGGSAVPVELPGYLLIGLGGEINLLARAGRWPALDLQLRVENLLDQDYQEVFGYRAPGRAFLLGGRVRMGGES